MATFRIGQRVRIKWSLSWPELAGQTGVIVATSDTVGIYGRSEWLVAPDSWGHYKRPQDKFNFAPNSDQLEPLTDRNTLVEWSECAWSPHDHTLPLDPPKIPASINGWFNPFTQVPPTCSGPMPPSSRDVQHCAPIALGAGHSFEVRA